MPDIEHDGNKEIHFVNYVMLRRIYDVLLGIYSNINPAEANSLAQLHDGGYFASPEPSYSEVPNDTMEN